MHKDTVKKQNKTKKPNSFSFTQNGFSDILKVQKDIKRKSEK